MEKILPACALQAHHLDVIAHESGLGEVSVVIRDLRDGRNITLHPTEMIYPASMIKVPIAVAATQLVAGGALARAGQTVAERHMTTNDAPSPFHPGYETSVDELVEYMIAYSDNVATNVLIDAVGRVRATAMMQNLGCEHTAVRRYLSGSEPRIADPESTGENEHPACDAANLLALLQAGTLPLGELVMNALQRQHWNTKLGAGLPPGGHFSHKTGDTSTVSHDGGILTLADGRAYVVVVYTRRPSDDATDAAFAAFMRALVPLL